MKSKGDGDVAIDTAPLVTLRASIRKRPVLWSAGVAALLILPFATFAWKGQRGVANPPSAPVVEPAFSAAQNLSSPARFGSLFRTPPTPGESFVYRFTWNHTTQNKLVNAAHVPSALANSSIGLTGEVNLTSLTPQDEHPLFSLRIENIEPLSKEEGGMQLSPLLIKQTAGSIAYLVFHADGALQSIRYPHDTPVAFQNLVQRFVGFLLHSPAASQGNDKTPFGVATTNYQARGANQILRTRVGYSYVEGLPGEANLADFSQELNSGALYSFREDGVLSSLADSESLRLIRSGESSAAIEHSHGFTLRLREAKAGLPAPAPKDLARLAAHEPWEATVDKDAERKSVEDRMEGLTEAQLFDHVRSFAVLEGKAPNQVKFFNRATGFLKLHPEVSRSFVDLVHEPKMTYPGRAFAVDILASAGNDVVQQALVNILSDPRTRALPEYVTLYQRIALIRSPSDATVEFARDRFEQLHANAPKDQRETDLRTASVYTLGSVCSHMHATGRDDGAERLAKRIVLMMDDHHSPRTAYIAALGNAGLASQEPLLLRLTHDAEKESRLAAINALRKYDTDASRERVLEILVERANFGQQREAIGTFLLMTPARQDIRAVAAAVVDGRIHRDLYGDLIPLFRKGNAPYADVRKALDVMFARSAQRDDDLQTRIDTLRAELSVASPPQ